MVPWSPVTHSADAHADYIPFLSEFAYHKICACKVRNVSFAGLCKQTLWSRNNLNEIVIRLKGLRQIRALFYIPLRSHDGLVQRKPNVVEFLRTRRIRRGEKWSKVWIIVEGYLGMNLSPGRENPIFQINIMIVEYNRNIKIMTIFTLGCLILFFNRDGQERLEP